MSFYPLVCITNNNESYIELSMRDAIRERAREKREILSSTRTIRIVVQRQYDICGRLWSGHSPEITIAHTAK